MNNKTNKTNKINELNELNLKLNIYDVAIWMVSGANSYENQYTRDKISVLADQVKEYIESQAEVGLLSDAYLYYIVNSILSETIDQVIEWDGSLDMLKSMLVEPIECAYKAAIDEIADEIADDMEI